LTTITLIWVTETGIQTITGDLHQRSLKKAQDAIHEITVIFENASITNQTIQGLEPFVGLVFLPNGTQLGTIKSVSSGQMMMPVLNAAGGISVGKYSHVVTMIFWTLDENGIIAGIVP
jgi:hypothetical protein